MTRVLIIIDSLVPGGAERSTVALLPHLAARGIEPRVVVLHDRPGLQQEVRSAGFTVDALPSGRGRAGWFLELRRLIDRCRPDLIHTTLFEADVAGRLAGASRRVPIVSTLPTERYGTAHLTAPHLRRSRVRACQVVDGLTARLTARLHAVSPSVADAMASHLRYPRHRIDVVARGRARSLASPSSDRSAARRRLGLRDDAPVVVALARHEHAKGLDLLLDAWPSVVEAVPTSRLVIAGRSGAQTDLLRRRREELAIEASTQLAGHVEEVEELLATADAFVLPSRREGSPGALLEAMAAGVPAVANDLPAVRDVVGPEHVTLIDATEANRLSIALIDTLTDRRAAGRRAELARAHFLESFTLEASADGMACFYRRALGGPDPVSSELAVHQ